MNAQRRMCMRVCVRCQKYTCCFSIQLKLQSENTIFTDCIFMGNPALVELVQHDFQPKGNSGHNDQHHVGLSFDNFTLVSMVTESGN